MRTLSTTSFGEHRVTTPFSDIVGSGTALNMGADVLSADVGVKGLSLNGWKLPSLLLQQRQLPE